MIYLDSNWADWVIWPNVGEVGLLGEAHFACELANRNAVWALFLLIERLVSI